MKTGQPLKGPLHEPYWLFRDRISPQEPHVAEGFFRRHHAHHQTWVAVSVVSGEAWIREDEPLGESGHRGCPRCRQFDDVRLAKMLCKVRNVGGS